MHEKKDEVSPIPAYCSPPSHPTTLGDVWVGMTQPSATAIESALMKTPTGVHLEKSGDD